MHEGCFGRACVLRRLFRRAEPATHPAELGEDESEFDPAVRFCELEGPLKDLEASRALAEICECSPAQPQQPRQHLHDVQRFGALSRLGCDYGRVPGVACLERCPGESRIRLKNLRRFAEFNELAASAAMQPVSAIAVPSALVAVAA